MKIYKLPNNNTLPDELKDTPVITIKDLKTVINKIKYERHICGNFHPHNVGSCNGTDKEAIDLKDLMKELGEKK